MSRVPILNNFLCGCSLLTGAKVIGYAQVIVNGVQTIFYTYLVINLTERVTKVDGTEGVPPGVLKLVTSIYFEALCGALLIAGIYRDNSSYIKTWVVIQFGLMVQNVVNIFFSTTLCIFGYPMEGFALTKTIGLVLDAYYTLVIYSFYRKTYYRDSYGNLLYDEVIDSLE